MLVQFNTEKLKDLLKDFHTLTGILVSVFDASYREIARYPESHCAFCSLLRSIPEFKQQCHQCDYRGFLASKKSGINIYHCYMGLTECSAPIRFQGIVVGYMIFGQVTTNTDSQALFEQILEKLNSAPFSYEELKSTFDSIHTLPKEVLTAAAKILGICTNNIFLDSYAVVISGETILELEKAIDNHMSDSLTSDMLCNLLCVSRTKLYQLSKQFYGCGINEYIHSRRLHLARELLVASDLNIKQIAEKIGIPDYNYFSKLFKKQEGVSPSKYRKGHSPLRTLSQS